MTDEGLPHLDPDHSVEDEWFGHGLLGEDHVEPALRAGRGRAQQGPDRLLGHLPPWRPRRGDLHRGAVHVPADVRQAELAERLGTPSARGAEPPSSTFGGRGPGRRDGPIRPRSSPSSRPQQLLDLRDRVEGGRLLGLALPRAPVAQRAGADPVPPVGQPPLQPCQGEPPCLERAAPAPRRTRRRRAADPSCCFPRHLSRVRGRGRRGQRNGKSLGFTVSPSVREGRPPKLASRPGLGGAPVDSLCDDGCRSTPPVLGVGQSSALPELMPVGDQVHHRCCRPAW